MSDTTVIEKQPNDGAITVNGVEHQYDAKGHLVPVKFMKPQDSLEDQTVRFIIDHAKSLSEQIARFRGHTMTDLGEFDAQLAEKYNAKKGGQKGNRTYKSFDDLMKVQVQISEHIDFGPELQIAKSLIDECLNEWTEIGSDEARVVITRAFNTDKEGQINRSEIFMLLRLDFSDERWKRAMDAIRDAMRVTGSKEYVRFYSRPTRQDKWQAVTIDLAKT